MCLRTYGSDEVVETGDMDMKIFILDRLKLGAALLAVMSMPAFAGNAPGVTATEIKIGGIFPFSGPASALGLVGKGVLAYVQSVNDRGGINGRRIDYIALDDAYSPPKAVEDARRLVESNEVAFMFGQLGTPGNSATAKYLTTNGVPSVAIMSGANKFTDVKTYPLTTTALVSFDTEGRIYAKYLAATLPNAKYAILYQNDDLGKDYVNAFKLVFRNEFDKRVATAAYEITDPTIDSQIVNLRSSGAQALLVAGTAKFAAQAIRKVAEIGWRPTVIINFPSSSISATLKPAGLEKAAGVIVGTYTKDPTDPIWDGDDGMKTYRAFLAKYLPGSDIGESGYLVGFSQGVVLERLLRQCGNDLSRENIAKQAKSLKDVVVPVALPGMKINTSSTVNQLWTQMRLQRWNGNSWRQFGEVLDGSSE
jgi:branched-chain amino acid transport system substrate-binding protein